MKITKLLVILLLIISCSNKEQIVEFEKTLGIENSETLTSMVLNFENGFLKTKYPDLSTEKAYTEYLKNINSNIHGNWENLSVQKIEKFNKSNLKNVIYGVSDSIWIVDTQNKTRTEYRIRRKYLNTKGEYEFGTLEVSIPKINDKDSLISNLENRYYINYYGKYREALKNASKKVEFVDEYIKLTQETGTLHPGEIAYEMLNANLDFENYFVKRLILTEIVYRL